MRVVFDSKLIPYTAAAAATIAGVKLDFEVIKAGLVDSQPELRDGDRTLLKGDKLIASYILYEASKPLRGETALEMAEIDQWLEFCAVSLSDVSRLDQWCIYVDSHLQLRTFLVGHSLTLADLAVWGTLRSVSRWSGFCRQYSKGTLGDGFHHLMRWYQHIDTDEILRKAVDMANTAAGLKRDKAAALKSGEKRVKVKTTGGFDIGIGEDFMGKVVTRFPPEPSGYLHIGHVKAAMLNHYLARQYKGKMILRFDDTNPSKEKGEFVDSITHDLATLGVKADMCSHTSDYFPKLLDMCTKMIKDGIAYVDSTPVEAMREQRMARTESKYRTQSVQDNLNLWKAMQNGTEIGLQCCVRVKIDMSANNACLRDPIIYRCNVIPHLRTGTKYKVYPTYDFACPVVDSMEGVTHALRTTEYNDRNEQYQWFIKTLKIRPVAIWEFSRLNFVHTLLSKRKLQWFVDNRLVDGWNDPRFPTVQGMIRRGLTKEGLLEFIIGQGASKNVNMMEWGKLWQVNRKVIDPIAPRHTAVAATGLCMLELTDGPSELEYRSVPRHRKNPSLGDKVVSYSSHIVLEGADASRIVAGEEVTLMNWGNVIVDSVVQDGDIYKLTGHLHLDGDVRKTEKKLTWLTSDDSLPVRLVSFDYLITKAKVEEDDDFEQLVNRESRLESGAICDAGVRLVRKGDIVQFERRGYYICDEPFIRDGTPLVFHEIPDGHDKGPSKLTENAKATVSSAEVEKRKVARKEKK